MGWAEDIWNSAKQKVSNVTQKIGNAIDDGISFVKDNAHTLLDAAGFIPGVGTAADVINAGIYVAEGDWKNAGLCALSAVPGIGDGIAAVGKAVKVGKTISKVGKTVNTVVWRGKSTIDALKGDPTGAILDVLFSGKWKFKQKLGNFLGKVGKKMSYRLKPLLGRLGGAKDWLKKLLGKVKTGASKAGQTLRQWGKNLASKLKQKLTDLKERLKSLGKKIKCKLLKNGTCFTGDTLVYTKEGYLPIKNIRAGDDIYSREEKTGETGFQKVEEVFLRSVHTIYTIEVNTTAKIQTTSRHPFYVEKEGWVVANQLQVGMKLQTINGTAVITNLRKERTEEEIPVYNFRVSEWSSYFVSEWNVYVHNANEIEYTSSKKKDKPKIEGESGTLENYIKYTDEMKMYIHPPENGYDAFLEKKYIEIRKKGLDDISIVAQNTGLTEQEIIDLKRHVFLDTHELSFDGGAYQTSYFTADPDLAYAWEAATNGELSAEQKAWFRQMANHELGEKTLMDQGMPLRDPSTYQEGYGFKVDPTKNAHDAAPKQPGAFPGSTQSKDFMKYFDKDPEDY